MAKVKQNFKKRVSVAAGSGMAHEEIAIALGMTREELERDFAHELTRRAYERRLELVESLFELGKKGNVSAVKAYTALAPRVSAPPIEQKPATKVEPLGKKAQRNEAAKTAEVGTEWEDLLRRAG